MLSQHFPSPVISFETAFANFYLGIQPLLPAYQWHCQQGALRESKAIDWMKTFSLAAIVVSVLTLRYIQTQNRGFCDILEFLEPCCYQDFILSSQRRSEGVKELALHVVDTGLIL